MTMPDGILLALEGVLVVGETPIEGSVESIVRLRAMGRPFRILADPTSLSCEALSHRLGTLGYSIDPEEIMIEDPTDAESRSGARHWPLLSSRHALIQRAVADLALAAGAMILVVGDDFDSEIQPALDMGFSGLLVQSGDVLDEARIGADIPASLVTANFGAWLYRTLRLR